MALNITDDAGNDFKVDAARNYVLVTKDDNNDLPDGPCRGLLVGTAGSANLTDIDGVDCDAVPLQAGYNPLVVARVRLGGDADNIWALY